MLRDIAEIIIALSAFGSLVLAIRSSRKLTKLDVSVDGRLSQLLELTRVSSKAEGVKQELDREK